MPSLIETSVPQLDWGPPCDKAVLLTMEIPAQGGEQKNG